MWVSGCPKIGLPQNGWFTMENSIKVDDDWGYPYFRKPPYGLLMLVEHPLLEVATWGDNNPHIQAIQGSFPTKGHKRTALVVLDLLFVDDLAYFPNSKSTRHWAVNLFSRGQNKKRMEVVITSQN